MLGMDILLVVVAGILLTVCTIMWALNRFEKVDQKFSEYYTAKTVDDRIETAASSIAKAADSRADSIQLHAMGLDAQVDKLAQKMALQELRISRMEADKRPINFTGKLEINSIRLKHFRGDPPAKNGAGKNGAGKAALIRPATEVSQ